MDLSMHKGAEMRRRSLPSLCFLPLPLSAWLRCEIILLLGGFPAICHCHLLALRLEGGSLFQKHTALPLHHPEHNKFLGTRLERGAPVEQRVLLGLAGLHIDRWERENRRGRRKEHKREGSFQNSVAQRCYLKYWMEREFQGGCI